MALGKPVVSTAVGGVPELVQSAEDGFLTQVGTIDRLALWTMKLLDDSERRQQMGQRGARKVEAKFHLKHRVRFIENLYLEVLRRKRPSATSISAARPIADRQ